VNLRARPQRRVGRPLQRGGGPRFAHTLSHWTLTGAASNAAEHDSRRTNFNFSTPRRQTRQPIAERAAGAAPLSLYLRRGGSAARTGRSGSSREVRAREDLIEKSTAGARSSRSSGWPWSSRHADPTPGSRPSGRASRGLIERDDFDIASMPQAGSRPGRSLRTGWGDPPQATNSSPAAGSASTRR